MTIFTSFTVLAVDDQELMRSVMMNQLRAMGMGKVLGARNGSDALRALRAQKVDLILADWNMPVMSGLDLLRSIRADAKLARIPFLMITSETERSRIQDVIAAGVNGLLVKPYNGDLLRSRIERMLTSGPASPPPVATPKPAPSPEAASVAPPEDHTQMAPIRILVVDDNEGNLALFEKLFEDEFEVVTTTNAAAAIESCQSRKPPDLVLMDVQMPGTGGFEAVGHMREQPATAQIPVIFMTAEADTQEARMKGLELGAVDFVSIRTDMRLLRQRVRNFLRFVEQRKQLQAEYDNMLENAKLREEMDNMTRHDLKGSLTGLAGMARTLAADEQMLGHHVHQLKLMEETAQQALNAIDLSSDMFNIETGRYHLKPEPVAIGSMLRTMVEMARVTYADKNLRIVIDSDVPVGQEMPCVDGDEALCYSIFQNLIKNACEAAPNDTVVQVSLQNETPLRVLIQNKGVVPPAIRGTFFDKFVTQDKVGGTGLGTYSARLLVVAQGGNIAMSTDDAAEQTTITVWLPRHMQVAVSEVPRPRAPPSPDATNIPTLDVPL